MSWRNNLDPSLKSHLETQIKEVLMHKDSYNKSKSPTNAQLWVAIANLSRQVFNINLKVNYIERALRDIVEINKAQLEKSVTKKPISKKTKKKAKR